MIELIAAAVSGVVGGGSVVWWVMQWRIAGLSELIHAHWSTHDRLCDTLTALRSNCFIPDERGVKVRYSQASVERRIKAETPRETALN